LKGESEIVWLNNHQTAIVQNMKRLYCRKCNADFRPEPGQHDLFASGLLDGRESLAEAYAGLDRLLIITTVDPEPGKRGAQIIAAIDAAVMTGVKHIV
jgi:hypothetical protein